MNQEIWTVCNACGKRVFGDSIHTCSPQLKQLTDEEILSLTGFKHNPYDIFIEYEKEDLIEFARAILRKASEK